MHGNGWAWPMAGMMIGWLILVLIVTGAVWIATSYNRRPAPEGRLTPSSRPTSRIERPESSTSAAA